MNIIYYLLNVTKISTHATKYSHVFEIVNQDLCQAKEILDEARKQSKHH